MLLGGPNAGLVNQWYYALFGLKAFEATPLINIFSAWGMVFVMAFLLGCVTAIDNPTRQSFVVEMVGDDHLRNAVTLYSSLVNMARIVGPALAGVFGKPVPLQGDDAEPEIAPARELRRDLDRRV